jgi:hypothetical protein
MSSSDPNDVVEAVEQAEDAFEERGGGVPDYEESIESGGDWETQLTKACRLIEVAGVLREQNGYYTATIELCFGAIERSIEAYAVAMTGDEVEDFRDHEYSYERAHQIGLFGDETAESMKNLYSENRTESYYGGSRPTDRQADAMYNLAVQVHSFSVDQITEGGVCVCDT